MTVKGQNEVHSRSSIFRRAITRKPLQIGPNKLPLILNRKSWFPSQMAPLAWTSRDRKRSKGGQAYFTVCNLETLADKAMVTIEVE